MATSDLELGAGDSLCHSVQFLLDCKEKGRKLGNHGLASIFMVPRVCRDHSPSSFNPRVVSIGPLHRQDKNLQEFEVQKTTYLHHLLDLSGCNPEKTLQECVHKVCRKIELVKACYAESMIYNDEELVRMMVIDACFILDFIHLLSEDDGPFPVSMLIAPSIVNDMVLIENQIPFFVLKDIFESTILQFKPKTTLTNHIKILLKHYNIFGANLVQHNLKLDTTHDHILGFLHKCFQPVHDIPTGSRTHPKRHMTMDLDRAGVNFRPNEDANWAMAMKLELPRFSCFPWFWCKPTLRMPKVTLNDDSEPVLRNLITYEQSSLVPNYVTSYVCAMDMLIDTPDDVAKLVKSGVIANKLCSNEKAVNMINSVCKDVALLEFFYHQEWQELDIYYNSYWPNAAAGLKRTYFSSPWNMIALFAGIVLFVLTVVQTIFTIKAANPMIVIKH
ncbi:putative UPF0481 protein At3g02645 isoform X1 [Lactuca sativa]|uniref:putative UPF0481 protein At3g02645 isoform X1 n=2 Tax=Lactuca sativa TaxID=4236 RepID=UPI000CC31A02|nr:putative UPF0481 protein At3g02645 isoform X1 [Lactuca sativa]